ncbi:MAG: hypothetical protein R3A79_31420 [Nannocystaceae bacterium]
MFMRSTPLLPLFCALSLAAVGCDMTSSPSEDASAKAAVTAQASAVDSQSHKSQRAEADSSAPASERSAADEAPAPETKSEPADVGLGVDAASDRDVAPGSTQLHDALDNYAKCAMQCSLDDDERATDTESCFLSCRNVAESAGVAPGTPGHALVVNLDACIDICNNRDNIKETNRSTCRLNCENVYKAKQGELKRGAQSSTQP